MREHFLPAWPTDRRTALSLLGPECHLWLQGTTAMLRPLGPRPRTRGERKGTEGC